MSKIELAKEEIVKLIKLQDDISFVELENLLSSKNIVEKKTERIRIYHPKSKNLILWITKNFLVSEGIMQLFKENKILVKRCDVLVYDLDGKLLQLPIAEQIRNYKDPHWVPTVFSRNPNTVSAATEEEIKNVRQERRKKN